MNRTVGTCGACGGRVSVPLAWLSTIPPVPACESCGRQVARPWGPVVEMAPERRLPPGLEAGIAERLGAVSAARARAEARAEEAGSPVHDNYREYGYFKARRDTTTRISGPTNSTRFTRCFGVAVVRGQGSCPACGAEVVGGGEGAG